MRHLFLTVLIIIILFCASASAGAVYAQTFKLQLANPASPAAQVGGTFDVKVLINTAGKQSLGADAILIFEPQYVSTKSATSGNFYNVFQDHAVGGTTNKYLLSAWQQTELTPTSSTTDTLFATVTFNALTPGNSKLSLDCTSGNTDSNIWDTTQVDILKCADLQPLSFSIGGSVGVSPSPTAAPQATSTPAPTAIPQPTTPPLPTSTPVPTNTPKPSISILPRTGMVEVTLGALGLGTILTIVGILVIL